MAAGGGRGVGDVLAAGPRVRVRVLGRFEVCVDGRELTRADWQRVSAERLFKLLLVTPCHSISREIATETLWPEAEPELGRANLRKAIHFAHRALRPADILGGESGWLRLDAGSLDLDLDRLQRAFDADLDGACVTDGGTAEPGDVAASRRSDAIETILELAGRPLLPDDVYEDWLVAPRERLLNRWESKALVAAGQARTVGQTARAHEIVDRILERDPTDEAAHRLAIELYAAEGRHHAARRQYALCRQALQDGLGVEPSSETEETIRGAEHGATRRERAAGPRLIARRSELERIETLLDRVADGHLAAIVVRGHAGIGKTRLLAEIAALARAAGWQVVEWQAIESTQALAYAPLRVGLGSLVRRERLVEMGEPARSALATILPGLDAVRVITFSDRAALVAGLVAALERLARECPICLAFDDVAWLDPSTVETLAAAIAGLDAPVLLALTLRDDEPVPDGVAPMVEQSRRIGLELSLGPLATRDVEPLIVAHMGGETVDPGLVQFVYRLSAGNPLFCLELVRAAVEQGGARLDGGRWVIASGARLPTMPATVRRLVAQRIGNLPRGARELVATAAELGPEIAFGTLSRSLPEVADGLIPALDAALASGLLVERGTGYAFAHPLYRLAVEGVMGSAMRASVRLRIARALAGPTAASGASSEALEVAAAAAPDTASVAEHALTAWEHGALDAQELAIAFGFAAGHRERKLFNLQVAQRLLERSLAAWRRLGPESRRGFDAARPLIDLGEILALAGRDAEAEAMYRDAAENARSARQLADAYYALWELPYRHGDFVAALELTREGLARLPEDAIVERANLRRDFGWALARLRRLSEALEPTEEAASILEHSDDRRGGARAVDQLAMVLSYLGRRERWVELEERALGLATESGDSETELIVRLHLGVALTRTGLPTRARPVFERARELADAMGQRYGQALEAWGAAEMEDALGDYAKAAEHRRRELRLLASIGGNPHNEAMARAHLSRLSRLLGDQSGAKADASAARELALRSGEIAYVDRIERALTIERWLDMET